MDEEPESNKMNYDLPPVKSRYEISECHITIVANSRIAEVPEIEFLQPGRGVTLF